MPLFGEVITGILSSLVYDGLKRPYRTVRDASVKRKKIGAALEGNALDAQQQKRVKGAFEDLVRVIGGGKGEYTQQVAIFLRELERTAIPEAMQHFALCGRSPQALLPAFESLFSACQPLPFKAAELFDALYTAMKTRIELSVSDPVLLESLQAQGVEIGKQLELIEESLGNVKKLGSELAIADLIQARLKIAKSIESSARMIHVETNQGTRKVNISKLVIPARLTRHQSSEAVASLRIEREENSIGFIVFRRSFHKAVILGDPGGGKSTLTQFLSHTLSSQILLEQNNPGARKFDPMDLRLPLRIVLRTLQNRQQKTPAYAILDYLEDELRPILNNDLVLSKSFLRQSLALGQVTVLFDGLDEILEVEPRRAAVAAIEQFSQIYNTCPVLVTSRIVGYLDAPLGSEFDTHTLAQFNRDEVGKFSERLIAAVGSLSAEAARSQADRFVSQTETVAGDLRRNPLLLGLMVYIFMNKGDVPNNRPEIYQECALLMFDKWDKNRDIVFEFPRDFNLLDLFGFLAERIFGDVNAEEGVTENWLLTVMKEFFESWYEDRAKAVAASSLLVDFITGRAWVMCDIGPKTFKFTHRTFLEYFFARRIQEQSGSIAVLINESLLPRIVRAEWDVVIHLALQIATFRSGPRSQQAYDAIVAVIRDQRLDAQSLQNYLRFFARAFQYLSLPESKLREATKEIASLVVDLSEKCPYSVSDVLDLLIANAKSRIDLVIKEIRSVFLPVIVSGSGVQRRFCFYFASTRMPSFSHRAGMSFQVESLGPIWDAFSEPRRLWADEQFARSLEDVVEARVFMYSYGSRTLELYHKHGLPLFLPEDPTSVPQQVGYSGSTLLLNAFHALTEVSGSFSLPTGTPEGDIATINAINSDAVSGKFAHVAVTAGQKINANVWDIADYLQRRIYGLPQSVSKKHLLALTPLVVSMMVFLEYYGRSSDERYVMGRNRTRPHTLLARLAERIPDTLSSSLIAGWADGSINFFA
jgi:hypothetical protein